MKRALSIVVTSLLMTMPAWAEMGHAGHGAMAGMANTLSEGVVKKVDKDQGKLTISHGPLENLGMPAMTMIFRVQDDAMLDRVKPGDNIRFLADRVNGRLTVTRIETAQ